MTRPRILVVDDDPGMLHAVRRLLERSADVQGFADAATALAGAVEFAPELAILDVRLPASDGFELMHRLRRLVPGLDVVLMTGSLTELDGKLSRSLREEAFFFLQKPFDRELLLTLVERWRERRRLREENTRYTARLEEELRQARAFQQRMLPGTRARIGPFDLRGRYEPCDSLGGDFYDWADTGDAQLAVLVADVAGHGVAAAMLTGFVKAAFHAAHVDGYAPAAVVTRVRDGLRGMDEGSFVTLLAARIDMARDELSYCSAGHPYGAVLRDGRAVPLEATCPLLTPAFPDTDVEVATCQYDAHDDRLVLWTDGVEEAADAAGELFGRERTLAGILGDDPIGGVAAALGGFVGQRPMRDDWTIVVVRGD